ncbi:MAG: hypothetical protein E6214_00485 [Peptoniphilus harei]|nr:hypothetical protein [Peptoniphilus harei]
MKEIKVTVSLEEVLEFVREEDCKIEIDYDGNLAEAYVLPIEAAGFEDKINTQTIEAYDYQEFDGDEEAYIDWLTGCYDRPYEAVDGEEEYSIKIDFEK